VVVQLLPQLAHQRRKARIVRVARLELLHGAFELLVLLDVVRDGLLAGHDLVKPATDYIPDQALTLWALVLPFRLQTRIRD
jgi:hypothetical protein